MINDKTLQNMKIIKKFSTNEKDLKESTASTKLMTDFPPIYQERNSEALAKLVADYAKVSGIRMDSETLVAAAEVPLQVRRKRTASDAGSRASGAQTKKSRKDKSEASATDNTSAPIPERKRRREASPVNSLEKLTEAREERAKRMKAFKEKYETPSFVMTPEDAREAQKQIEDMLAERRKEKAVIKAARDEKLQSIGIDASDEKLQSIAINRRIAGSVEKQVVEEAQQMLELIPEASVAAPESTFVAEVSEACAQVIQTSNLPFIIPTPISPSNDSDLDDVPIGQRMRELSKPSPQPPQPQQTTPHLPLQAEQSSAAAECTEDPEDPPISDLPH